MTEINDAAQKRLDESREKNDMCDVHPDGCPPMTPEPDDREEDRWSDQLLRDVRDLIQSLPARDERAALAAMADLREWFAPLGSPSCPNCGHLADFRDGTHIRTGYRTCIYPARPGSWAAEDPTEPDDQEVRS